jgi:phospholipid/cholesterol/gamma-HCH transport system permease protein
MPPFSLKWIDHLAHLGDFTRNLLSTLGMATRLLGRILLSVWRVIARPRWCIDQLYVLGVLSLIIITISGLFVGFVLGLQGYYTLQKYGSEQALGVLVALSLTREMGPVITALLFAGRAGTALTAEIGLMKAGEQLSAMEMMAIDPIQRVLAPRFWAGFLAMPMLSAIFTAVGIFGGYLVGVQLIGIDQGAFWAQMQAGVDVQADVLNGLFKSVVFGAAVTFIALFQGYMSKPTPEGVSLATTKTVVISSLVILGLDFMLTAWLFS